MLEMDRRSVLLAGASAAILPLSAKAQDQEIDQDDDPGDGLLLPFSATSKTEQTAVFFWSQVALDLVALDHSIAASEARAPGPVATARALGLVYTVIADAVAVAYPKPLYKPYLSKEGPLSSLSSPAVFVGGAAAAIVSHIYTRGAHIITIRQRQEQFLARYGHAHQSSWDRGLTFGKNIEFTSKWNWKDIQERISVDAMDYKPGENPELHRVDPLNVDQGFYGQTWGVKPDPLVLTAAQVTELPENGGCAPKKPPTFESNEFKESVRKVREMGALHSENLGDVNNAERTPAQLETGIYWAYDGAIFLGTPPRQYTQIVLSAAIYDGLGPRRLARQLALCNLAMSDAGNVAWHAKYRWKYPRPVRWLNPRVSTVPLKEQIDWVPLGSPRTNRLDYVTGKAEPLISALNNNPEENLSSLPEQSLPETAVTLLGATLRPEDNVFPEYSKAAFTPNFPAYPSGHATLGAACFETLKRLRQELASRRGNPRQPDVLAEALVSDELDGEAIDNLRPERRPEKTKTFMSIEEMKNDNSNSRELLGVHWDFDAQNGQQSGDEVASKVVAKVYRPI